MGRTLKTIVQTIHGEEDSWRHFRRSLRKEDQAAFDLLWRFARKHAASASMASRPIPFEAIVMSMLVGLARTLKEILEEKKQSLTEETQEEFPTTPPSHVDDPEKLSND